MSHKTANASAPSQAMGGMLVFVSQFPFPAISTGAMNSANLLTTVDTRIFCSVVRDGL